MSKYEEGGSDVRCIKKALLLQENEELGNQRRRLQKGKPGENPSGEVNRKKENLCTHSARK